MKLHLDTDFAGDTDDAAALVMLLGLPGVDLVGVTTVADPDGRRAAYVRRVLDMARRGDVPVAAGAGRSSTTGLEMGDLPDHDRYWGGPPVEPLPSAEEAAVELLTEAIAAGATLAGIGPYTNLAAAESAQPGCLASARVGLMGGWVQPPADGYPPWGPARDWNVQCDTTAAEVVVASAGSVVLSTINATLGAQLRRAHLPRLEASGPLGRLVAHQALVHAEDNDKASLAVDHPRLAPDLLNFQWDPFAVAVAAGVEGIATVEVLELDPHLDGGVLSFPQRPGGRPVEVVTAVDGEAFAEMFLKAVERADELA